MIQRIQTVYLLLSTLFTGLMFTMALTKFIGGTEIGELWAHKIISEGVIIPTTHMAVLIALATLLPFVNIFLFKRRWLQIRLCFAQIILNIGIIAFLCYYLISLSSVANQLSPQVSIVFPLLSIILSYMAYRGVAKDEALIKSLNRIR